jgi:hypothetical protein
MGGWEEAKLIAKDWLATTVIGTNLSLDAMQMVLFSFCFRLTSVSLSLGFLVASYWRGTWTLFDVWLCDQPGNASLLDGTTFCFAGVPDEVPLHRDSGWKSIGIGWGLTLFGVALMWSGLWRPAVVDVDKVGFVVRTWRIALAAMRNCISHQCFVVLSGAHYPHESCHPVPNRLHTRYGGSQCVAWCLVRDGLLSTTQQTHR